MVLSITRRQIAVRTRCCLRYARPLSTRHAATAATGTTATTATALPPPPLATPMLAQYFSFRDNPQFDNILILFQMGQFLEAFFEDAAVLSKTCGIAYTARGAYGGVPIPMAGVPLHSKDVHLARLVRAGIKVAVCEQLDGIGHSSSAERGGALMRRQITRVYTRGTAIDESLLTPHSRNYVTAMAVGRPVSNRLAATPIGLSWLDCSTGEFFSSTSTLGGIGEQLAAYPPAELLLPVADTTLVQRDISTLDEIHKYLHSQQQQQHSEIDRTLLQILRLHMLDRRSKQARAGIPRGPFSSSASFSDDLDLAPPSFLRLDVPGGDVECAVTFRPVSSFCASSPLSNASHVGGDRSSAFDIEYAVSPLAGIEKAASCGLLNYVKWTQCGNLPSLRPVVRVQCSVDEQQQQPNPSASAARERHFLSTLSSSSVLHRQKISDTTRPSTSATMQHAQQPSANESVNMDRRGLPSLYIDPNARRALELTRPMHGRRRARGSLLHTIDMCCTAMGSRLIDARVCAPLASALGIRHRHDAVQFLLLHRVVRQSLRAALAHIPDLERCLQRVSLDRGGGAGAVKDLFTIRDGLSAAQRVGLLLTTGDHVTWHPNITHTHVLGRRSVDAPLIRPGAGADGSRSADKRTAASIIASESGTANTGTVAATSKDDPRGNTSAQLAARLLGDLWSQCEPPTTIQDNRSSGRSHLLKEWARFDFDVLDDVSVMRPVTSAPTWRDDLLHSSVILSRCAAALLLPLVTYPAPLAANADTAAAGLKQQHGHAWRQALPFSDPLDTLANAHCELMRALGPAIIPRGSLTGPRNTTHTPSPSGVIGSEEVSEALLIAPEGDAAAAVAVAVAESGLGEEPVNLLPDASPSSSDPTLHLSDARRNDVIAPGYDAELDAARALRDDASAEVAALQQRLREMTGIRTLRVRRSDALGHVAEVSAKALPAMEAFVSSSRAAAAAAAAAAGSRRVTDTAHPVFSLQRSLKSFSRYKCDLLDGMDAALLQASARSEAIQTRILRDLRSRVVAAREPIAAIARALAVVDVSATLAELAARYQLCRPLMTEEGVEINRGTTNGANTSGATNGANTSGSNGNCTANGYITRVTNSFNTNGTGSQPPQVQLEVGANELIVVGARHLVVERALLEGWAANDSLSGWFSEQFGTTDSSGGFESSNVSLNRDMHALVDTNTAQHTVFIDRDHSTTGSTIAAAAPPVNVISRANDFDDRTLPRAESRPRPRIYQPNDIMLGTASTPEPNISSSSSSSGDDSARFFDSPQAVLLCGPNMGGKSTYLRSAATIVVLAQMGSFVPAASAQIGVVDRLFSRVGANDDVTRDKSTFLVEMEEVAVILRHATPRSLVVVDEVGRGTSSADGLALAWSVLEHLTCTTRCRTLFATHIHELVSIAAAPLLEPSAALPQRLLLPVRCMTLAIEDGVHLTHKFVPHPIYSHPAMMAPAATAAAAAAAAPTGAGTAWESWRPTLSQSYGVHVAELAGLPSQLIHRARGILDRLDTTKTAWEWARAVTNTNSSERRG